MVRGIVRKVWWNQDQHLLEVTAEILQDHLVRTLYQRMHRREKHNLSTHFPEDTNCEIRKRTKVTRAACRRNSQSHILRTTKFRDIIAANHKVLNEEEGESRSNHKYAIVVQDLPTLWIQSDHSKKNATRNGEKSIQGSGSRRKSNGYMHRHVTRIWTLSQLSIYRAVLTWNRERQREADNISPNTNLNPSQELVTKLTKHAT